MVNLWPHELGDPSVIGRISNNPLGRRSQSQTDTSRLHVSAENRSTREPDKVKNLTGEFSIMKYV